MSELDLISSICKPILPCPGKLIWIRGCWCSDEDYAGGSDHTCGTCGTKDEQRLWSGFVRLPE